MFRLGCWTLACSSLDVGPKLADNSETIVSQLGCWALAWFWVGLGFGLGWLGVGLGLGGVGSPPSPPPPPLQILNTSLI